MEVPDDLRVVGQQWWREQAEKFPEGKIPGSKVSVLMSAFVELGVVPADQALKFAQESGVLQEDSVVVRSEEREEGKGESSMAKKPLTGAAKIVWENLEATGNNTEQLVALLVSAGFTKADNQAVSQIRYQLRKDGYNVPKGSKSGPRGKGEAPAPATVQSSSGGRTPNLDQGIKALQEKIKALEDQAKPLQEMLHKLLLAKEVLTSIHS